MVKVNGFQSGANCPQPKWATFLLHGFSIDSKHCCSNTGVCKVEREVTQRYHYAFSDMFHWHTKKYKVV